MDQERTEVEVLSHSLSGQESLCAEIHAEVQDLDEPPPSYEFAQLSVPQLMIENPEEIAPVVLPPMHVVSVDYPKYEPDCEDYFCACLLPACFVGKKRGCCSMDVWINIFLEAVVGWPCSALHALDMLHEPDNGESRQVVVTLAPGATPSSSASIPQTIKIQVPIKK